MARFDRSGQGEYAVAAKDVLPKMCEQRARSCREVLTAARDCGEQLSGLDREFGEGTGALAAALVERIAAGLAARHEAVDASLERLASERSARATAKASLVDYTEACRKRLVPARGVIASMYGEAYASALGFEGRLSEKPGHLLSQAEYICARASELEPPHNGVAGMEAPPSRLLGDLPETTDKLREALQGAVRGKTTEVGALIDRNLAVKRYDYAFKLAANLLCLLVDAAGQPTTARRLRPSGRRPGTLLVHSRRRRRDEDPVDTRDDPAGPRADADDSDEP